MGGVVALQTHMSEVILQPHTTLVIPRYTINANYRDSDPYHDGYRSNERLKMTMSNFKILIDPDTIAYGKPQVQ